MKSTLSPGRILRFALVFLLVLQLNALPVHEFLLVQQGYTLVGYGITPSSGTVTKLSSANSDTRPYDVSSCWYHQRILVLSVFLAMLGLLVDHCFTNRIQTNPVREVFHESFDRLTANPQRAPPLFPSRCIYC